MNTPVRFALLAAFSMMPHAQANELGRLFFTPTERSQFEQALKARQAENGSSEQSVIAVNGIIQRSDGSRIVWINGKVQHTGHGSDPNKVPVLVPGKNNTVEVKVGQRVRVENSAPNASVAPKISASDGSP